MNARIRILLDSRDIEELAADDAEVLGMWGKAARTYQSAGVSGLENDPDARFTLLYPRFRARPQSFVPLAIVFGATTITRSHSPR